MSIENLGESIIKMSNELSFRRETKAMEAENELAELANPVSLLESSKSELKVIDLLSINIDTQPPLDKPQKLSPLVNWVVFHPQVED